MGLKRALGGGVAMAVGATISVLIPVVLVREFEVAVDTLMYVSVLGSPVAISSSLVAGSIVWAVLPRGKRTGVFGGVIATALAYPLSLGLWIPIFHILPWGDISFGFSVGLGIIFIVFGALVSGVLTLPIGGACGYLYEYVQQRFNLFQGSDIDNNTEREKSFSDGG
jgi:hypothetical protein